MATLAVDDITSAGSVPAALVAASGGGDQFQNDGKTILTITNGSGAPITVTVVSQVACNQGTIHPNTIVVAAGATKRAGPFDPQRFNDGAGYCQLTYSVVTSLTVGVASL
jgi:hypothetical protein